MSEVKVGERTVLAPTVHLNGTSKGELARQLEEAVRRLTSALDGLTGCSPNGRDYYPQGADALSRAAREHSDRMERIRSVRAELRAIWEAIEEPPR